MSRCPPRACVGCRVLVSRRVVWVAWQVNCSPALGVECTADREVKEPLIADLVDLLDMQREQANAMMPAGGGARAAPQKRRRTGRTTQTCAEGSLTKHKFEIAGPIGPNRKGFSTPRATLACVRGTRVTQPSLCVGAVDVGGQLQHLCWVNTGCIARCFASRGPRLHKPL